jgi:murein L,D-transpeptidase YafK
MRLLLLLFLFGSSIAFAEFTLDQRLKQFAYVYEDRVKPTLTRAGLKNDPQRGVLVFYKDSRRLELYAGKRGVMRFIKSYLVTAASGSHGPKLRRGDRQVPEGVYKVTLLNPNSRFHLSLRLDYPNLHDRLGGRIEGRADLGGDIMIHGKSVSEGCIAIGDEGIEEIFMLAAKTDLSQWKVISSPTDFRIAGKARELALALARTAWHKQLYDDIESELEALPSKE